MKARISATAHEALLKMARDQGVSMSELARRAVSRVLGGEVELPDRQAKGRDTSFVVSPADERAFRELARSRCIPVDEAVRYAIDSLILTMSSGGLK